MTNNHQIAVDTDHDAQERYDHDCYISDRRGALLGELGAHAGRHAAGPDHPG